VKPRLAKGALIALVGVGTILLDRYFGGFAQALSPWMALLTFALVYRWHRREIRAGRREPVFFGRGKQYPLAKGPVPFDKAMSELGPKLDRHPNEWN
jgi:hypothetical protein